jgi:hypothetical protein
MGDCGLIGDIVINGVCKFVAKLISILYFSYKFPYLAQIWDVSLEHACANLPSFCNFLGNAGIDTWSL